MIAVFDVNGTLLDTGALRPMVAEIFSDGTALEQWFCQLIQYAMGSTLAGEYRDFGEIAISTLRMQAEAAQVRLAPEQEQAVARTLRSLPPFPEVPEALRALRDGGFTLVALSNSGRAALGDQLRNAGIAEYFTHIVSVEAVRKFKPAPEVYREAARVAEVPTDELLMIAAHPWDLMGAAAVGCRTAILERPGTAAFPGARPHDYRAKDLADLARQLLGSPTSG